MVNKMFVMLPVMMAARKLDSEDPDIVFKLRCTYFSVQAIILLVAIYIFLQVYLLSNDKKKSQILASMGMIYLSAPANPFADPEESKNKGGSYTQSVYKDHLLSQARSLVTSTIMGVCMTSGLHFYRGMIVGLAIQSVMGPFNLFENKLAKAFLFKRIGKVINEAAEKKDGEEKAVTILKQAKIFDEKYAEELEEKDEVKDKEGNILVTKSIMNAHKKDAKLLNNATKADGKKDASFEDVMLDTWDSGDQADVSLLLQRLNKQTVNYQTKESKWTPLMTLCAVNVPQSNADAYLNTLKKMKALGADAKLTDEEGWSALHWACFHGGLRGAQFLLKEFGDLGLAELKDKEGMTPLDHAKKEKNMEIAKLVEQASKKNE